MKERSRLVKKKDLVSGINPIRYSFLAQVIHFCFQNDLFDFFIERTPFSIDDLCQLKSWDAYRTAGLLQYLTNEGFLERSHEQYAATQACHEIQPMWPWYRLLVGGYGNSLNNLQEIMCNRGKFAERKGEEVGIGSCGISQQDALLMTVQLLEPHKHEIELVVDIGCGDGSFLLDLCEQLPGLKGLGVDPEPASVDSARSEVELRGLQNRVEIQLGSASDLPVSPDDKRRICFLTAFVLQEVLEQDGRDFILNMMKQNLDGPERFWAVVEVKNEHYNSDLMTDELALAYYNPYFLIHHLTEQRLESAQFWESIFREVGAEVIGNNTPNPAYDDLGLKMGFLLRGGSTPEAAERG